MPRIGLAGLVLLAGCQDYNLVQWDVVDAFNQKPADKVDILMVVDNSCSMQPFQQQLASNFQQFISFFIGANVDYQIGVTTTTIEKPTYDPVNNPDCTQADIDAIPDAGHLVNDSWIDSNTADAETTFQNMVKVGTCGSGFEMGLEGAREALQGAMDPQGPSVGFIRSDAQLSVIFVSDEEDSSPDPVNKYINDFYGIKGQRARGVFNASALAVQDTRSCPNDPGASVGTRYMDVATETHGVLGDLCSTDFSSIVTDLSLNTSRLRDTFFLSQEPDASTIQLSVDDVVEPCEQGGWVYTRVTDQGVDKPAIVFSRDNMPQPGSRIAIRYNHGNGDPANFCPAGG